ncbi:MAG TPA: IS607 family transposase [Sulfurihydrogenibium sp.]|uniref:IS607 family transposase n=1 Tax=Sulfurihydrogenibium sp. (strain YO3AOP1) TaxID=436114 RepID=UPI0001724DB8|nr:IS607 family transposase [Sulfurihydrogenibium sp. YO3AOP1]ACD67314.1 regulatory protein MerR [Sulfurihydrogenibium sp. YO3AOP1]HBT99278.1 IS607 family transposase [Sulfurihydrogenibium sp.]
MYKIGQFSKLTGISISTLRLWDKKGILKPEFKTPRGERRYSEAQLQYILQKKSDAPRINVGYARVSSKKQEDDLKRQIELLELFLAKQGKPFKIISDMGSGINYSKSGLKELLKLISSNQVDTIYVLYKDRLVRFGFELIEEFAKLHNTKIEIMNQTEDKIDEEELVEDILNIIHVFSRKLNGKKSHINKKIAQRLLDEKQ